MAAPKVPEIQITPEEFARLKAGMTEQFQQFNQEFADGTNKTVVGTKFEGVRRPFYLGEVGSKDGDIYYHFFPADPSSAAFPGHFGQALAQAFSKVFAHMDGEVDHCPDMDHPENPAVRGSIALRIKGAANNLFIDTLLPRLFDALDKSLAS